MKTLITILFLSLAIMSCGQNRSENKLPSKECIQLNDKGVEYMMKPTANPKLDTAITFFKKAIVCDNTYLTAYINLVNAYEHNGEYNASISTYNRILAITNNYPVFVVQKAILFEKMNYIDSAKNAYFFAKNLYAKKLALKPNDIDVIKGSIYLKALISGKDSAIDELDRQIKIHPTFASKLNNERYIYEHFDRKALTTRPAF